MLRFTMQYEVNELAENGRYYRHGYRGPIKTTAYDDLKHKRDTYGKYGRVFVMKIRQVSDWEVEDA